MGGPTHKGSWILVVLFFPQSSALRASTGDYDKSDLCRGPSLFFLGGAPNRTSRTGQTSVLGIKKWGPIGTSRTSLKKANRSPPT